MLNLKAGPGKQTKGAKKHRQERGEQPQKKDQQDVFGDHCHLARFVLISYCCYKNNRCVLLQFGGPEVRMESSGAKIKVLAGLLSSGNRRGEGPSSPLPASGSGGSSLTPMSTSMVRSLLFCSLSLEDYTLPTQKDSCDYT